MLLRDPSGGVSFICSATLVSLDTIITAAHCFVHCPSDYDNLDMSSFKIVLGKSNMRDPKDNLLISGIASIEVIMKYCFIGG